MNQVREKFEEWLVDSFCPNPRKCKDASFSLKLIEEFISQFDGATIVWPEHVPDAKKKVCDQWISVLKELPIEGESVHVRGYYDPFDQTYTDAIGELRGEVWDCRHKNLGNFKWSTAKRTYEYAEQTHYWKPLEIEPLYEEHEADFCGE